MSTSMTSPMKIEIRCALRGPFTVDSLSPHRLLGVDENDELIDNVAESKLGYGDKFDKSSNQDFATMILEHLKTSGVQQGAQRGQNHVLWNQTLAR